MEENDINQTSTTPGKPIRTHGVGAWGGRRIVAGFRCDEELWNAFKPWAGREYGSICKALESVIVALMVPMGELRSDFDSGLTPGSTSKVENSERPILQVQEMHIHRNLSRERRNLKLTPQEARVEASSKRELETSVVSDWSLRIFDAFVSEGLDPNRLSALYPFLHDVPENIRGDVRLAVIDRLVEMVHGVQEVARV